MIVILAAAFVITYLLMVASVITYLIFLYILERWNDG